MIKTFVLSAAAAAMVCGTSALAADMPVKARPAPVAVVSPWDWAFGGALMSDYNFRGISQSNRGPSVTAYSEGRFNVNSAFQLYAGSQYWAVTLPSNPTAEVDGYGGFRVTQGPVVLDIGGIYYWYPREKQHNDFFFAFGDAPFPSFPNGNATLKNTDYWEVYGKLAWDAVKDRFAVGANVYYSPSWLNTGADGLFASVTAKVTGNPFRFPVGLLDEVGWYISGEFGHYWLGTADVYPLVFPITVNRDLPDYSTWNVGLAFTWKVATLDLRYYDTSLSKAECSFLTGDPNATLNAQGVSQSKWCSATFIAALKFDLTASSNLK